MKKDSSTLNSGLKNAYKDDTIPSPPKQAVISEKPIITPDALTQSNALYEKITNILMTIGMPAHVNGYHFLREAILLTAGNFDLLNGVRKKLYPLVANRFKTTDYIVERSIRNAIEIAYNKGKITNLNNIFGIVIFEQNDKPSNSELIALLAEKVYLDCNSK